MTGHRESKKDKDENTKFAMGVPMRDSYQAQKKTIGLKAIYEKYSHYVRAHGENPTGVQKLS